MAVVNLFHPLKSVIDWWCSGCTGVYAGVSASRTALQATEFLAETSGPLIEDSRRTRTERNQLGFVCKVMSAHPIDDAGRSGAAFCTAMAILRQLSLWEDVDAPVPNVTPAPPSCLNHTFRSPLSHILLTPCTRSILHPLIPKFTRSHSPPAACHPITQLHWIHTLRYATSARFADDASAQRAPNCKARFDDG
ncbi:hypothetical protein SAICODRAFT_175392 [Saitoella complicata NRRL Y-17804]|uniref:uncharacterized protein n=1 Tax=Saitoella complicata (strain BCRC 22490 / CBS 7301 / JCM 7358 / NBRC 10748 / NRRL Y-17804) TaxID=698492 RepID=UPI000867E3B3|nr:uncharacterized protein SAICODRAFT_175392 [Saitoella complicata NRRL Y-17804]ODQ50316.1 hypothetical protein SAICODRAFT_175392 [Saitoella complicata NRRL Y-17804]